VVHLKLFFYDKDVLTSDDVMCWCWLPSSVCAHEKYILLNREDVDGAVKDKKLKHFDDNFSLEFWFDVPKEKEFNNEDEEEMKEKTEQNNNTNNNNVNIDDNRDDSRNGHLTSNKNVKKKSFARKTIDNLNENDQNNVNVDTNNTKQDDLALAFVSPADMTPRKSTFV